MTMHSPVAISAALLAAEQGATVITANKRSARNLLRAYAERKRASDERVWRTPDVVSWEAFLMRAWSDVVLGGHSSARLLSSAQESALWERIIGESRPDLLNPATTAEKVAAAWKLTRQFGIAINDDLYLQREGTATFRRWSERFLGECNRNCWIDGASLPHSLLTHVQSQKVSIRRHLVLIGFDDFTPQQRTLLEAFSKAGASVQVLENLSGPQAKASLVPLRDTDEEIRTVALWARRRLEETPEARIGIVVPALADLRRQIETVFLSVLHPDQLPAEIRGRQRAFEISVGPSLADRPVVATALLLVKLATRGLTLAEAGSLLRSPFLAGGLSEASERALLDCRLRENRVLEVSVGNLRDQAYGLCPILRQSLKEILKLRADHRASPPREWAEKIAELLSAVGWTGGDRSIDSDERQAVEAFAELLSQFGLLQEIEPSIDAADIYTKLNNFATRAKFEPEKHGAPIQIVGMLEAAGSFFEHMWVMGLHDGAWPAASSPSPFIPLRFQIEHQVPHATPALDLRFAERVKERLLHSAQEVVFSYPQFDGDTALRPSPLLQDLPDTTIEELVLADSAAAGWGDVLRECSGNEILVDESAPAIPEGNVVKGGTRILKMQSACPFRAFVELRLGAVDLETPEPGLDNRQRGTIVHRAMELVWDQLKDHRGLVANTSLPQVVRQCVSAAMEEHASDSTATWEQKLSAIEQERITALICQLLEGEKARAAFTVAASERSETVELGGLKMRVKVDRIDRLDDGRQVLIDYKTGDVNVRAWETERPEDPQLPAYAAIADAEIAAVTFAQLKAGEVGFCGYSPDPRVLPAGAYERTQPGKDGESLAQVIDRWRKTVNRLAREHCEGRAEVDPAKGEQTCRYCTLAALCRIAQEDLASESGDEN